MKWWCVFLFSMFIPTTLQTKLELIDKKLCDEKNSKNEWREFWRWHFGVRESSSTLHKTHEAFWLNHTHSTISRWYNQQLVIFAQLDNNRNVKRWTLCATKGESVIGCTTSILFIVSWFLDLLWILVCGGLHLWNFQRCVWHSVWNDGMFVCWWLTSVCVYVIQIACGFVLVICYSSHHFYHIFSSYMTNYVPHTICLFPNRTQMLPSHFCTYYI